MRYVLFLLSLAFAVSAGAVCTFTTSGSTMSLDGDCTTDTTILVPDGFTLDGSNHTITAVDPMGDHFRGAVVANGGTSANVVNLKISAGGLMNACDAGGDRLRGIMLDGASGTIAHNTVLALNQGASGCQEGNAIEVRNAPFDGTHPSTLPVTIAHNNLHNWQKTGIVVNGDVSAWVHHNDVTGSATQANLAANGIQIGFGAAAAVEHNQVEGNSWCCADAAATAVLLFLAESGTSVNQNNLIGGNADVGLYALADGVSIVNNKVFESGADGFYDIGIGDYGVGNFNYNNKVKGYATAYDGNPGMKNKTIPGGP